MLDRPHSRTFAPPRPIGWTAIVIMLLGLLTSTYYWFHLTQHQAEQEDALRESLRSEARQITSAVEQQLDAMLRSVDVVSRHLSAVYRNDRHEFEQAVKDVMSAFPPGMVKYVTVFDPDGNLVFSSEGQAAKTINISDREHFRIPRDTAEDRLFISQPIIGRLANVPLIQLTRPILDGKRVIGVIGIPLQPEYLSNALYELHRTPRDLIAVVRNDGSFIARSRLLAEALTKKVPLSRPYLQAAPGEKGAFTDISTVDQIPIRFTWTHMAHWPVSVMTGMAEDDLLAPLRQEHANERLRTALLIALLLLASLLVAAQQERMRRQHTALEESEERFRNFFTANYSVMLLIEPNSGRIVDANPAAARYYGYTLEELRGLPLTRINTLPEEALRTERELAAHEERNYFNFQHQLSSGEIRDVEVYSTPIRFRAEILLFSIVHDVSDRKKAEAELFCKMRESATILDNSSVGISFVRHRTQVWANRRMSSMFGYPLESIQNQPTRMFYFTDAEHAALGEAAYPALHNGERFSTEQALRHGDGHPIWIRLSGQAIDPELPDEGSIWVFEDITAQKASELELEAYRKQLESMVRERTADLEIAKEAAEAASRAKTTFLSMASHELRTPMNGVMGMLSLARKRITDPAIADYLDKADRASRQLLGIINDVLDISRIEANRLTLAEQEFTLGDIREHVLDALDAQARARHIALRYDEAVAHAKQVFVGDPTRLTQILINLVGNAIKFTPAGEVSIHIQTLPAPDPEQIRLHFDVRDTGIGIPAEALERIFEPFEQVERGISRQHGGTGLGLALCKRLSEAMGGGIGVESTPGAGSRFWFEATVGLARANAANTIPVAADAASQLETRHAGAHILVAEDEPLNQEITREMLEAVGLRVSTANNGQEAGALAREQDFDLILMDMNMPIEDGLTATRRIRQLAAHASTPIIAMTANAFSEDREHCLAAGMNDHIGKPVMPEVLYQSLLHWLEQAQQDTRSTPS